jgi:streptogramin lyase
MTLTGAVTEFPVPAPYGANSYLYALTPGLDGNLWFVSHTDDQIGRMTLTGTVKVFPLPAADSGKSSLSGMTNGPDGNLWFTEAGTKKIAYIVVEKK